MSSTLLQLILNSYFNYLSSNLLLKPIFFVSLLFNFSFNVNHSSLLQTSNRKQVMILRDFDFCWKSPTYKNNDFPILGNTNGSNCNELNTLQKLKIAEWNCYLFITNCTGFKSIETELVNYDLFSPGAATWAV